ncbi:hypothetical protein CEQ90_06480 [Lewinellaceae bacterium SD302]|nr:hypothetical protein CEQ90_06480 [Lewinellaceae bacterium SD302]
MSRLSKLLSLLLLCASTIHAQPEEVTWFFGGLNGITTGLQFSSPDYDPIPYNGVRFPLALQENNIIVANQSTGAIQFYSDGQRLADASHNITPNGNGLAGTPSAMYGTSAVLDPASCSGYLLFYQDDENVSAPRQVYYSLIDLDLAGNGTTQNPLGDVVSGQKNIPLFSNSQDDVGEGLFALTKSSISKESWLFVGMRGDNSLRIYNISASGISLHQTYSLDALFPAFPDFDNIFGMRLIYAGGDSEIGRLIIAPARAIGGSELPIGYVEFDRSSGEIQPASMTVIATDTEWTYGLELSPDRSKLYYSDYFKKTLHQYDFNSSTLTLIGTSAHQGRSGGLLLAPNGEIFWSSRFNNTSGSDQIEAMSIIRNPNEAGLACNLVFDDYDIQGNPNPNRFGALPTFGAFPRPTVADALSPADCDAANGSAEVITGSGTPPFTFEWDNGETTQTATALNEGEHSVTVTEANGCTTILTIIIEGDSPLSATANALLPAGCVTNDGSAIVEPSSGTPPFNYQWDNGETTQTATALSEGDHSVTLTDATGCVVVLTTEVAGTPLPEATLDILAPATCELDNGIAEVTIESGAPPFVFQWSNGETTQTAANLSEGEHTVSITDANDCMILLSFTVAGEAQLPPPVINSSGSGCVDSSFALTTIAQSGIDYLWLLPDGSESSGPNLIISSLTTASAGSYTVSAASSGCGSTSEPFELTIDTSSLDLDDSLFVCNNLAIINSPILANSYSWSNGSNTNSAIAAFSGNYGLTVTTENGCTLSDSTYVTLVEVPRIELDSSIIVAECQQVFIEAMNPGEEQLFFSWTDDGSFQVNCAGCPSIQFFPDSSGTVFLETTSAEYGCTRLDSVAIDLIPSYDIYIPNSFSPNFDGVNDGFTVFAKNDATRIARMEIFSRWGELLFQETDLPVNRPALGWLGNFIRGTNRPMMPGVYVYQITVSFVDGSKREYAGNMHLVR